MLANDISVSSEAMVTVVAEKGTLGIIAWARPNLEVLRVNAQHLQVYLFMDSWMFEGFQVDRKQRVKAFRQG